MFLPVILIHRYGWLGFLLFSVPNIIGCTAFGYVLRTPERSKALVEKYKSAMSLFAVVTIAFHVFFIAMLALVFLNDSLLFISAWLPFVILLLGCCLSLLPTRFWPILAVMVWSVSLLAGISLLPVHELPKGNLPWQDVVWLLPITTFGFFLSPYLDPTFHKALQQSPSKHSFGVFGIAFLLMIGITIAYVDIGPPGSATTLFTVSALLGLHFALQAMFTIGAHFKEGLAIASGKRKLFFVVLLLIACFIADLIAHRFGGVASSGNWLPHWQEDYVRFFVFYGLIFPAIVATFMFTGRRFTPLRIALFTFAGLLSLPLLEVGYLHGQAWLTVLPVVVFLVWAFADRKSIT